MMKSRLFLVFLSLSFVGMTLFSSCEDDEDQQDNTTTSIIPDVGSFAVEVNTDPVTNEPDRMDGYLATDNDGNPGNVNVRFSGEINNPDAVSIGIQVQYPNDTGFFSLVWGPTNFPSPNATGLLDRTITIDRALAEGGATMFRLVYFDAQSVAQAISDVEEITFNWASVDEAAEEVRINSIELVSNNDTDGFEARVYFSSNSLPEGGLLENQLFVGGNVVTNAATATLIGSDGFFTITNDDPLSSGDYVARFKNEDENNPSYKFLNENGEVLRDNQGRPVTAFTLPISIEMMSEPTTASMDVHSVNNITTNSFEISTDMSFTNIQSNTVVTVQLFNISNQVVDSYEIPVTQENQVETLMFPNTGVLIPNTSYRMEYMVTGQSDPFFVTTVKTLAASQFAANLGNFDMLTPNTGRQQVIYTNQGENPVNAELVFKSTLSNGENWEDRKPIMLNASTTNGQVFKTTTGHSQNSMVTVDLYINGVSVESNGFPTSLIDYENYANVSTDGTSNLVTLTPGQSLTETNDVRFDADGNGSGRFQVVVTTDGILPMDYIDAISINGSASFDPAWTDLSSNETGFNIPHDVSINSGTNSFTLSIKTENYSVQDITNGFDEFRMRLVLTDDANQVIGGAAPPITLRFE